MASSRASLGSSLAPTLPHDYAFDSQGARRPFRSARECLPHAPRRGTNTKQTRAQAQDTPLAPNVTRPIAESLPQLLLHCSAKDAHFLYRPLIIAHKDRLDV